MEVAISTQELTKIYRSPLGGKGLKALDTLSLDVQRGETLAIIGPNGSGKTTTLKILLGLIFPTSGEASILGEHISSRMAREKVGYLPEEPYFYDCFSAEELLDYYGRLFGLSRKVRIKRTEELLTLVGLSERRKTPLREYSKGMRQRAGLAQALINDPEILILDEPTSGLDPEGAYQMRRLIRELRGRGKTILLCSHFLAQVEDLCDRVAILDRGTLKACGSLTELVGESRQIRVVAEAGKDNILPELNQLAKSVEEREGKIFAELDEEANLMKTINLLQEHGGRLLEVLRPRPSLEQLFIQVVSEASE